MQIRRVKIAPAILLAALQMVALSEAVCAGPRNGPVACAAGGWTTTTASVRLRAASVTGVCNGCSQRGLVGATCKRFITGNGDDWIEGFVGAGNNYAFCEVVYRGRSCTC